MNKNDLLIYTDGASRGNPGKAGWGCILMSDKRVVELAGASKNATNNQMELLAVQRALEYAREHFPKYNIIVHSDSAYVINGITSWIYGWQKNNWITSTKKPVENKSYWQELIKLKIFFKDRLEFVKVAGHSGHIYNERCDELAVNAALGKDLVLYDGKYNAYEETLAVLEVKTSTPKKSSSSNKKAYAYVSFIDGVAHSDKTWEACEKRVKGRSGAKYKKVFSKEEETQVIQDFTLDSLF